MLSLYFIIYFSKSQGFFQFFLITFIYICYLLLLFFRYVYNIFIYFFLFCYLLSYLVFFIFIIILFSLFVNFVSNEIDIYCKINYERRNIVESLGYLLYLGAFCFFIAIILGIAKGTSQKYLIQTLEETESEFNRICWNVFYVYLIFISIAAFSFISLSYFFGILVVFIPILYCFSLYLFILTLVLVIRFYSNIEMKEIIKPLIFSLIIQIVNHLIPIAFIGIPIYLTRRKKQRELLKMFSEKE